MTLLLAKGYDGQTAWDFATRNGNKETLETLWARGKDVQVNLKDDLLLVKGYDGQTAGTMQYITVIKRF